MQPSRPCPLPLLFVSLAAALPSFSLHAQEAGEEAAAAVETEPGVTVSDGGNRVAYGPEYFSRYNVVTALDQIERIPGLQGVLDGGGGNQRGFGNSGDQVLINGKRLSGKTNDIGSTLGRIQARQVRRIEVIRGMVAGLDVRSQGRVVNVVLNDTLVTGYGSWEGTYTRYSDGREAPGLELNYAGDVGAFNYLLSASADPRLGRDTRTDTFHAPDGRLFERQDEVSPSESEEYSFTANTTYTFANNDLLNLNALYSAEDEVQEQFSDRYLFGPAGPRFDRTVLIASTDDTQDWELGGDYEHVFANGNVLTGIFVYSASSGDEASTFEEGLAGEAPVLEEIQIDGQETSETIARGTYRWGVTDRSSFESGLELALNSREQSIRLLENDNGILIEAQLFNQDSTIEEERIEGFTTWSWQATPSLYLESSVDLEFSEITQEGADVNRSRDFFFARPRVVLRYDLSPLTQLRGRIERTVSQLNFGDFVASFTNDDNRSDVISAGNPELVPEQAWEYEATWERRLPDDQGLLAATLTFSQVRDQIGPVPLLVRDEDGNVELRTAPGNLGEGKSLELLLNGSLRLGFLGLPRALLEAEAEFQETEIVDPFTGQERDFSFYSPWRWSLGLRHDTRWRNFSYGFTAFQEGPREQFDLDYRQEARQDVDLEFFAEFQPLPDLTVRLDVEESFRAEFERERIQFVGNRANGVVRRLEHRLSRPLREITLSVRGVF